VVLRASRACATSAPWSGCWWISARRPSIGRRETVRAEHADRFAGSALRTGEDHARLEPGAGAAGGAHRPRPRVAARRLRHRRAAHQSASSGGLEHLGAQIQQEHGYIEAVAPDGLRGRIVFDRITVTGTEDLILMAAVLAEGETVMRERRARAGGGGSGALLIKMGAKIEGAGTSVIRIKASPNCTAPTHTIIADRIEAGTFVIAGAITGGDLTITGCVPEHLLAR
jgi:hypothetical protein